MVTKRNRPCPCGSNIKYKKCCGNLQPSELAQLHFNRAKENYNNKLFDEAILSLLTAGEIAPENRHISNFLLDLLNNYTPNIETDNSYLNAQKTLQQINKKYGKTSIITDETVRQLYTQCHDVLALHRVNINTNLMQLYRGEFGSNNCRRHWEVFNQFKIIPEYCFGCYKVTIAPRTMMELFKLLLIFDNLELHNNNHRKCLIEMRPEISGTYKGLIYCRGLDEGKEILNIVQPIVNTTISNKIPIHIKRGCSEFPLAYPEYGHITDNKIQQMQYNEAWRKHEEHVDKTHVKRDPNPNNFILDHSGFTLLDALVMRNRVAFAENKGDSTLTFPH